MNPVNTLTSALNAGGFLRGEVGFERWYFHYNGPLKPEEIAKDPSILIFSRLWAVAYAIESFVKTIIVAFSLLYYVCLANKPEVEQRMDVLYEQDNSLYYSIFAIYSPEKAMNNFSVYNKRAPTQSLTRTRCFGFSWRSSCWGTSYKGETTLNMLIHTH